MSLSSFFLVMHEYQKKATRRAGYIYFIFTHVGAMFIFAAFSLAYSYTGSFDFLSFTDMPGSIKIIVFFLALVGFGSKAGIFPLQFQSFQEPKVPQSSQVRTIQLLKLFFSFYYFPLLF